MLCYEPSITKILKEKAKEGVHVVLIYDDFGCVTLPRSFMKKLMAWGVSLCLAIALSPALALAEEAEANAVPAPAGEVPVPGVSGKTFLNVVLDHQGHPQAAYVPRRIDVVPYLASKALPGDLVITMGAGDVVALGPQLADALRATTRA